MSPSHVRRVVLFSSALFWIACTPSGDPPASVEVNSSALTVTPIAKINFQPASVAAPAGYVADTGLAFDATRKFGWVRQDSLSGTHVPLDISPNTRKRNRAGIDPRLDTIIHMQYPSTTNPPNVGTPAAWEYLLPNASYRVTVSVGDQPTYNSVHTIRVEGAAAITGFQGTASAEYKQATIDVTVADGRLTIDAIGGTNTKLDYLDISRLDSDGSAALQLENLDEVPFADRLVTSMLTDYAQMQVAHTRSKLRVRSTGTSSLSITGLTFTGPFRLNPAVSLPINVAPGASVDLTVEINATSGGKVITGNLALASNAGPTTNVQLAATRTAPEGGNEPSLLQIVDVFGYETVILNAGQTLDGGKGHVETVGEEVLAPYWRTLVEGQPVVVYHLASFHGRSSRADLWWHQQGSTAVNLLIPTAATNAQTLLPRREGSTTAAAKGSFSNGGVFGFRADAEWSDPTLNDPTEDLKKGCQAPCGHHMRFWPAKDRAGAVIPGVYLMGIDIKGINYDYQDNVYLVTNVIPAASMPTPPPAPTGLRATPGNGQVTLMWNASPGATSYTVKSATVAGGPYDTIPGVTGTSRVVTGLTNGTPYFFVVSASNAAGDSPDSAEVPATPTAAPIGNLVVNDSAAGGDGIANNTQWSIQSNLQAGLAPFGDRTFTIASVGNPALLGKAWIRTAADSKAYAATTPPLATFTVTGTTLYLAVDNRLNTNGRPTWLDPGFTDEGTDIVVRQSSTATYPYSVWKKTVTSGSTVVLPTINSTAAPCYFVIVQ